MRCTVYLFLALLSFDSLADTTYEEALQTGVYESYSSEKSYHPFAQLSKSEGVKYERMPLDLLQAFRQLELAKQLNQYSQSKKIHTVLHEDKTLKYKAVHEVDAISVTTTYLANNQEHSKIWFYKPSTPSISYELEKNQAIKVFWPSGKLQSQEYFCSGVPVGYTKYFNEDGKLYGVIDWTQSDYEIPTNKMYPMSSFFLSGYIYLSVDKSLVFTERLSTLGRNAHRPESLRELDVIPFAETYQRYKLGMRHLRPLDNHTEQVLKCPWLDEAMSYSNEDPRFALPAPKPITEIELANDLRTQYEACIFKPNVDCLSDFAFKQTANGGVHTFYKVRRLFTALGKKGELNHTLQNMRERGIDPYGLDFEKKVNKQSDVFLKVRAEAREEIKQAEIALNNAALVKALRKPVYVEPLNTDLSTVIEINDYNDGADRETYLLALASASEVYADTKQTAKAIQLLKILELYTPSKKLHGSDSDLMRINNIRAEMAIAYSRMGNTAFAKRQLDLIEYRDQPIIHGTYFSAYAYANSALHMCRNGDLQTGRDFLSSAISMQKNNRLQISETLKLAIDECRYPFDLKRIVGGNYNNPYGREGFAGYPQMWLSYELHYKGSLPTLPIDFIEKQRKESEAKEGTNKSWINQNYYSQKINSLFASGQIKEAKQAADEYERFVQAGSWYKFSPSVYTKVGRLRAKYGDCEGALNSFNNAVKSLQLNKMNVNNSFVIRHPHYTLLPYIAQGMAYCGASVEDVQKLQIDFDYSAPAESIQNNRRADAIEIEMAINEADRGNLKAATNILNNLNPSDLRINALVTIAEKDSKKQREMKPILLKELNAFNQYFGTQHGAKEQRRAIGGFLEILDMYVDQGDKQLPIYLTELAKHVEIIPQAQFKARAMCHLGYLADKKQVSLDKDYFNLGKKVSEDLSWAYGSPAGSCAYWLKKAGRVNEAQSLLDTNMAAFRAYKTDPNNPNNWRKYAKGEDLANAAFVYWEYEHGEMPSKYDEVLSYYQDSTGLIEAY